MSSKYSAEWWQKYESMNAGSDKPVPAQERQDASVAELEREDGARRREGNARHERREVVAPSYKR